VSARASLASIRRGKFSSMLSVGMDFMAGKRQWQSGFPIKVSDCSCVINRRGKGETYAITSRSSGHTSKPNLVELIPFSVWLPARIEEVRRVRESSCGSVGRVSLPHEGLHNVHCSTEEMRSAA
jgi:hypothetical protein